MAQFSTSSTETSSRSNGRSRHLRLTMFAAVLRPTLKSYSHATKTGKRGCRKVIDDKMEKYIYLYNYKNNNYIWATSWQNQQSGMCAQRRLRSTWISTQSDRSLRCPHEESLGPQLPIDRTAKTLPINRTAKTLIRLPKLIRVLAGRRCNVVGFVMRRLIY